VTAAEEAHRRSGVDVIVRFHDPSRLDDLNRAIFSLVGQRYRPIRILLALQRFDAGQREHIRAALAPMLSWAEDVELVVLNFDESWPADARGKLLDIGAASATGRYLGILDYDDVLLPHAYEQLVGRLKASGAAVAFARTPVVKVERHDRFFRATERAQPFSGYGLCDLLVENFCPIHSYLLDRHLVDPGILRFDPDLSMEEDYEFLIRLCANVRSDFALLGLEVGFYFQEVGREDDDGPEAQRRASLARAFVGLRRSITILSPDVQRVLGVEEAVPNLTVQDWIDGVIRKGETERMFGLP